MKNFLVMSVVTLGLFSTVWTANVNAQVGTGPAPPSATVQADRYPSLGWTASVTPGVTYNVYRGVVAGGAKGRINPSPIAALTYRDATSSTPPPTFGTTEYYTVTAFQTSTGIESVPSVEVSAAAIQGNGSVAPPTGLNIVLAILLDIGKAIYAGLKVAVNFLG